MKNIISDYSESDFLEFVKNIYNNNKNLYPTEESHIKAVLEFKKLTGHPAGSDLLYYPEPGKSGPEAVVKEVKEWRAANGKPGFKTA
ncbi:bacteriocin immunity protein [Pseudomonas protegens]|uniref:Bacteriocin immunity protein n=1 Tax=Pseudomonas protegens TaxID=380021 RepID=A0A2T6GBK3_9PSED|nr:bacteriocin immunity protein [Pseudomonas protegens]PUA41533.1 bacteriocin immunity protein [Pseudomonas protegens]